MVRQRVVSTVLVFVIGLFSFLMTRYVTEVSYASAQTDSEYTWKEVKLAILEDGRKDRFIGSLSGIQFKEVATATDIGCANGVGMTDAGQLLLASSPLRILPEYLPQGYALKLEAAAACSGQVISAGRLYTSPDGGDINIAKFAGRSVTTDAPRDRMETLLVNGKSAVLVRSLPLPGLPRASDVRIWRLIMVEDFGITEISASHVSLAEVLKVAEGVR